MRRLSIVLSLLAATIPAQTKGFWLTEIDAARAAAAKQQKLLLVVAHRAGEPDSEQALRTLYGKGQLEKALRGCVPLLLCDGEAPQLDLDLRSFGISDPSSARSASLKARRELFGELPTANPQFLLLHPEGDLLWQHAGACNKGDLLEGLEAARKTQKLKPLQRLESSKQAAARAAASAADDKARYADVLFRARFAPQDAHWAVLAAVIERPQLARQLVGDLRKMLGAKRFAAVANAAPASLQPFVEPPAKAPGDPGSTLGDLGPLGTPEGLKWHGEERPLHRGKITVLWLCLPTDKTLPRQLIALRDAATELGEQVDIVALAASVDLEADLQLMGKAGFPVPAAVYRYDSKKAFAGVDMFPGAVVVDRAGTVVHRTADDRKAMRTSYSGFIEVVRALAARDG